jgi:hypothetical protein
MKNLDVKFRGYLPENNRKKEDAHPDFLAKLNIWGTPYSAAAWLSRTSKGDPYVAIRLANESKAQAERIKLAAWRVHERTSVEDPHFESVQEIFGREFTLKVWLLQDAGNYRLALSIDPLPSTQDVSDAMLQTRKRISDLLSDAALPALQPAASRPVGSPQKSEPDDIPF